MFIINNSFFNIESLIHRHCTSKQVESILQISNCYNIIRPELANALVKPPHHFLASCVSFHLSSRPFQITVKSMPCRPFAMMRVLSPANNKLRSVQVATLLQTAINCKRSHDYVHLRHKMAEERGRDRGVERYRGQRGPECRPSR